MTGDAYLVFAKQRGLSLDLVLSYADYLAGERRGFMHWLNFATLLSKRDRVAIAELRARLVQSYRPRFLYAGECPPVGGLICRRFYPGNSACAAYGGRARCIRKPGGDGDHEEGTRV